MTRLAAWRERRREQLRASRLRSWERELADAVYDLEHWSFADRPSQYEDRKARIHKLIERVEECGGDALQTLDWSFGHLAAEAMPGTFERVQQSIRDGHGWETVRR